METWTNAKPTAIIAISMHSAQMQLVATTAPVFQVSMGMDINVKT